MITIILVLSMLPVTTVQAWTDQAHMAMGKAVGFARFHNCAAPDVSHTDAAINACLIFPVYVHDTSVGIHPSSC